MRRILLPLLVLAILAAVPATSQAAFSVGFSEQRPDMFSNPLFTALGTKQARVIVSWDVAKSDSAERQSLDKWITGAQLTGVEPLVSFGFHRGCFVHNKIPRKAACKLPSPGKYRLAFQQFRARYPKVHTFSPWNEANHFSQPTYNKPARAADYYDVVVSECPTCKVVALDVLDQPTVTRKGKTFLSAAKYARKFRAAVSGTKPKIWGLHNYTDINHFKLSGTRALLRAVKGEIWLTETGGVVKFGKSLPYSPTRAARATSYLFDVATSNPRITHLYIYQWSGASRSARFDAGVVSADNPPTPRPAYFVIQKKLAALAAAGRR